MQGGGGGLSFAPIAGGIGGIAGECHSSLCVLITSLLSVHYAVVVVVIIVIVIIIILRRRRRSEDISGLATTAAREIDNITYELPMDAKKDGQTDETVKNTHYYASPGAAQQENIYANPTASLYDKPADDTPTNTYVNQQAESDHKYDVPWGKKTSTSSLSFMRRKESKYGKLSNAEEPGD